MKHNTFCIICLLLAATLLTACGNQTGIEPSGSEARTEATESGQPVMVSMYDLRVAMLHADPAMPEMKSVSSSDDKADQLFTYLAEFDYEKVEGYFLSYAADGMAYEVAVVCLKDAADVAGLKAALQDHVEGRVNLYKTYAPEQMDRAKAAEFVTVGRYVALIMCDDRAAVRSAFQSGVQ